MASEFSTQFMQAFTEAFIKGPGVQWPKPGTPGQKVAKELNTISTVLLEAAVRMKRVPKVSAKAKSLKSRVCFFLGNYRDPGDVGGRAGWPLGSAVNAQATALSTLKRTLRLTEAQVIIGRLIQAASDLKLPGDGGGGESTKIPPHIE